MIEKYNYKLIKSGNHLEIYDYKTKDILRGFKKKVRKKNMTERDKQKIADFTGEPRTDIDLFNYQELQEKEEQARKAKTKFSLSRTRTNIRRTINANNHLNTFLTLTFAQNITELKQANYVFNQFIKRMKYQDKNFEYIAVPEFQKRGAVHYHLLCNLSLPKFRDKSERFIYEQNFAKEHWKQGFITVKPVEKIDNMGAYFCKYLGKDMFDARAFGKKKFFKSQSLSKPIELIGYLAWQFFQRVSQGLKLVFEKTFKSDWTGEVDYKTYQLNEDEISPYVLTNIKALKT